jgi:hypothetical protein
LEKQAMIEKSIDNKSIDLRDKNMTLKLLETKENA